MEATKIYNNDGVLSFGGEVLATVKDFEQADRCAGSVFEALEPEEIIELSIGCGGVSGFYELDYDLDLIRDHTFSERASIFLSKKRLNSSRGFLGTSTDLKENSFTNRLGTFPQIGTVTMIGKQQ